MSELVLDVKGLTCPLPILRAKKALKAVPIDAVLTVIATDPGSVKDMEVFCQQTGNQLLSWQAEDGAFIFRIKRLV